MSGIISSEDAERLAEPHICPAVLLDVDTGSETLRMHNGAGSLLIGGEWYRGVSNPAGSRMVKIGTIVHPEFGKAAAVEIILTGADLEFFKEMHDIGRDLEGRSATIYFVLFDQETQEIVLGPYSVFPRATLSAIKLSAGPEFGLRNIAFNVEGPFADINFPAMGSWSGAGQRGRYSGDKGMDFMGIEVQEVLEP